MRSDPLRRQPVTSARRGFTLIELMTTIAILGMLLAILLPAVQQSRESARLTSCRNNLRQIGVALHSFESAHGRLPPGRDAFDGRQHSWVTHVLPQLDQSPLFQGYDFGFAPQDPENQAVSIATLPVFRCPSALEEWPGKTDYGGNYGSALTGLEPGFRRGYAWDAGTLLAINIPLPGDYRTESAKLADVLDGTSNTFLVLEDADRPAIEGGVWALGHNCFAHDRDGINGNVSNEIFSRHPGGAHALYVDGSVRFLTESTSPNVLGAMATRSNGESVGG